MPTRDEHVRQAEHNHQFWSGFNYVSTPFIDWVVAGIFYEAVHWIEAFLATENKHSGTHAQRLAVLQQYPQMTNLHGDLFILKTDSENARYKCFRHNPSDIQNDMIPRLTAIERHIRILMQRTS